MPRIPWLLRRRAIASRRRWPATLLLAALGLAGGCSDRGPTGIRLGSIDGQVLQHDGLPAANAPVFAMRVALPAGLATVVASETDAQGHFTLGPLVAGAWIVTASQTAAWAAADTIVAPASGAVLRLDVAGAFRGRATLDGFTRHDDIQVTASPLFTFAGTDSAGLYRLGGIPPGAWRLIYFRAAFRDTAQVAVLPAAGDTVTVPDMVLEPDSIPPPQGPGSGP